MRQYDKDYVMLINDGDFECYQETLTSDKKNMWKKAMQEEDFLYKNNIYELVYLANKRIVFKNKWLYKVKHEGDKCQLKYKTILIVKVFR